jgi:hypothetical protein
MDGSFDPISVQPAFPSLLRPFHLFTLLANLGRLSIAEPSVIRRIIFNA